MVVNRSTSGGGIPAISSSSREANIQMEEGGDFVPGSRRKTSSTSGATSRTLLLLIGFTLINFGIYHWLGPKSPRNRIMAIPRTTHHPHHNAPLPPNFRDGKEVDGETGNGEPKNGGGAHTDSSSLQGHPHPEKVTVAPPRNTEGATRLESSNEPMKTENPAVPDPTIVSQAPTMVTAVNDFDEARLTKCRERLRRLKDKQKGARGSSGSETRRGEEEEEEKEPEDGIFRDPNTNRATYLTALDMYYKNLKGNHTPRDNGITDKYVDVIELPDHGVLLPHDPCLVIEEAAGGEHDRRKEEEGVVSTAHRLWRACDPQNAEFNAERDTLCQAYLSNLNNMRSIKAMTSKLYSGRTIKFKIFYRHNNITAIVKVPQEKFILEAASEFASLEVDRVLEFNRVPISAYFHIPIDYMRAASGVFSPFYSTWFERFIPQHSSCKRYFQKANVPFDPEIHAELTNGDYDEEEFRKMVGPVIGKGVQSSVVLVQLWMKDIHIASMTKLKLDGGHHLPKKFLNKYFVPGKDKWGHHHNYHALNPWPPADKNLWLAVSEVMDRFIYDYLLENTDRGMNDHNNFVFGGCSDVSEGKQLMTGCRMPIALEDRTKTAPRYAFLDQGSSFYSRREPKDSVFIGALNETTGNLCRFRKSTYDKLVKFKSGLKKPHKVPPLLVTDEQSGKTGPQMKESYPISTSIKADGYPYTDEVFRRLKGKGVFHFLSHTTVRHSQHRLNKIVWLMDRCVAMYGEDKVFSLMELKEESSTGIGNGNEL